MRLIRDFTQTIVTPVASSTACDIVHEPLMDGLCSIGTIVNEAPVARSVSSGVSASAVIQDLTYTARSAGESGNLASIEYVDPSAIGQALSVSMVSSSHVLVSLATSPVTYEVQRITFNVPPDAGSTGLHFGPTIDTSIDYTDVGSDLQTRLRNNFAGYEAVTVTGNFIDGFTITFTGLAGDRPTITLDTSTLTHASVPVDVTITQPVAYSAGGDVTSTATQIKAAIEANTTANALVSITVSGTGSDVQTTQSETYLSGGTTGASDIDADTFTFANHGYKTGLKVQLTTTGTLPTGLATLTSYYLIVLDSSSFKFASSMVRAIAGNAINLTSIGSGTHTVTPAAMNVTVKARASSDGFLFVDVPDLSTTLTDSGDFILQAVDQMYAYIQIVFDVMSGQITVPNHQLTVKGD
jgi:hypothetical protein